MDPSVRTVGTFLNEDQRWIGNGGIPIGSPRDIVLDRSGFDLVTAFPNGFIPSGVGLARVAATGMYVPYAQGTNEAGTLTRTSTGGDIRLIINGEVTGEIPASAAGFTAAVTQAAIRNLGGDYAAVTVTGADGGPLTVTFAGMGADVTVEVDNDDATGGTIVWATTVAGGTESPAGEGTGGGLLFASVAYDRDSTGDISAALFWNGEVLTEFLPTGHGVDAAFRADTKFISYI